MSEKRNLLSYFLIAVFVLAPFAVQAPQVRAQGNNEVSVRLLAAGTGPRRRLRYNLSGLRRQSMTMDLDMSMAMSAQGQNLPATTMPRVRMVADVTPDRMQGANLRYNFRVTSMTAVNRQGIDPAVLSALTTELGRVQGMHGWAVVNDRGLVEDMDVALPSGAGPQARQMMEMMRQSLRGVSSPLPIEEVGRGARWEVTTNINNGGVSFTQRAVYTLSRLTQGGARMTVALTQTAPRQSVSLPNLPAGTTATLESLRGSGAGRVQFRPTALVSPATLGPVTTTTRMQIQAGGQNQRMGVEMEMTIAIR